MTIAQANLASRLAHKIVRRDSSIVSLANEERIKRIRYYIPIRHADLATAIAIALPFVLVRK